MMITLLALHKKGMNKLRAATSTLARLPQGIIWEAYTSTSINNDLDRLLNSSSAVPFLNDTTLNQEQNKDELVDYDEDDEEGDIIINEEDKNTRTKIYGDDSAEVEAHDNAVAERDDNWLPWRGTVYTVS